MGLDITAYPKVTPVRAMSVEEHNSLDEEESDEQTLLYQDGDRPQSDDMLDGIYSVEGVAFGFRAGSYGGYNAWRNQLSTLMLGMSAEAAWRAVEFPVVATKSEALRPLPFIELIHFSDCEGFIGPKTSAKLAKDFADYADKAAGESEYFREKYSAFRRAFELAANGGVVKFH